MKKIIIAAILLLIFGGALQAQTTAFVFQGKLQDGSAPANGSYQFQFRLFDAGSGGNQIGQTLADIPATVTNGIFAVTLDFGANSFDGAARFIEVGVRLNGSGQSYTILNPRQAVSSTPYAVKSLKSERSIVADNSLNLGGIAASEYVITNDTRLSDDRNPLPDSPNYIQNTTNPQAASNFNISGEGRANVFSANSQFNIGSNRVFHLTGTDNTFVGRESGNSITTGGFNTFFGKESGKSNTTGLNNTFVGAYAGRDNIAGTNNAFFGANAGLSNRANFNAFFGSNAGFSNFNGTGNSFFGSSSGLNNDSGQNNTFIGTSAGSRITTGSNNTFIGALSGTTQLASTTGSNNTAIGYNARIFNNPTNATVIGANATTDLSNSIVLGSSDDTVYAYKLSLSGGSFTGGFSDINQIFEVRIQGKTYVSDIESSGSGIFEGFLRSSQLTLTDMATGGNNNLCWKLSGTTNKAIATCSSSIRYKENVQNFTRGLELLRQLRPVTFNWKSDGMADVGFIAEEINRAEPLLSTFNDKGEIEGVKYAQITTVLVNSVNQQQTQIENLQEQIKRQQEQIKRQQEQIEALKTLICTNNSSASICQPNKDK